MQLEVVNSDNKKVGAVDLREEVFGGPVNAGLMWESVVHANASERRGTHQTKNRANVSGSGKKPWRQKGTGRARVGSSRTPLWRHGGTVFGPQPRSYDFKLSKKVERGALRAALAEKVRDGALVVVDALAAAEIKTKAAVELLTRLGVGGKAVLVDVVVDEKLARSVANMPGVSFVTSAKLTAREVADAGRVVATRGALEKLQDALASASGGRAPRERRV
jgi:large subunit ribosomal protein L4